ncbi:hypothetical protein RUM43_015106 [Polyplax serrata]|uniref:Uncharacterized protein n=1 Tax=Polyplax serrata TaxID=468196 RepID=A0AAN8S9G8_POLSC
MPPKASGKAVKKAGKAQKNITKGDKKKKRRRKEKLCHLHLQSVEASSSRHWNFQQSHEHHEFLRKRHLRKNRSRGISFVALQQEVDNHKSGNPDCCEASLTWRIGKTRRE